MDMLVSESTRSSSEYNELFVKMLEDKKQDSAKDAKEVRIKNINRYLRSTENYRALGLVSLAEFLELHTVVNSSFTTEKECQELEWIEQILRIIENNSEDQQKCFAILTKLIVITAQHPDMHKIVQGKYVSKVIEKIMSTSPSVPALQCLQTCLKEYGGTCGIFKNKIFNYCIASVDKNDLALSSHSAKCLHFLQQSRGGSTDGNAHKKNWAEYHEKVLNTLKESFNCLLQTGESTSTGKSERLKLPEKAEVKKNMPQMYMHQENFTRFQNICILLNTSLIQPFPTAKSILLDWMMSFLDKSIMINQNQINKKDGDRLLPFVLNIEIHKCLLEVLKTVIKAVGRNIIVYSKDVCDLLWRCLKSTNVPYDEFKVKDISSLRCLIYDTIVEFVRISPNNHFINKSTENFMKEAFMDITPIRTEILLTLPTNEAKKKKKRDPEVKRTLSGKTFDNCIQLHQQLCLKSLNFLNNLLIFNGSCIKPVLFKILTDKILITAYKFLSKDMTQQELYHSSNCRLMILEVTYNILINPAVRNATPSSFMVELLKRFKDNDTNEKVRHKASEMIRNVEAVLHSRKDPIHFPPDLKDFRDSWLFNEKTVKAFAEMETGKFVEPAQNTVNDDEVQIEIDNDAEEVSEKVQENGHHKDSQEVMEVAEEEILSPVVPTKRRTISKNEDEVPVKVSKTAEPEPEKLKIATKSDDNEDEVLDSYMADFCDD